jgi:hypothetical protein
MQLTLFVPRTSAVEEELRKLDVENMPPVEALVALTRLRAMLAGPAD